MSFLNGKTHYFINPSKCFNSVASFFYHIPLMQYILNSSQAIEQRRLTKIFIYRLEGRTLHTFLTFPYLSIFYNIPSTLHASQGAGSKKLGPLFAYRPHVVGQNETYYEKSKFVLSYFRLIGRLKAFSRGNQYLKLKITLILLRFNKYKIHATLH